MRDIDNNKTFKNYIKEKKRDFAYGDSDIQI